MMISLGMQVEGVRVVDEVPQDLRVVGGGHDQGLSGPVVQDELVGELAVLQFALASSPWLVRLAAPVGVCVGDLGNLYRLLGVPSAQGEPPLRPIKT